jgi:hypothetical protein
MESLHLIQDGLLQCNKNDSIIKNDTWELQELLEGKKNLLTNGYKVKTHYGGGHFHNMYVMYIFAKCVTLKFGFHFWCLTFTELMILNIIWKKEINLRD